MKKDGVDRGVFESKYEGLLHNIRYLNLTGARDSVSSEK